MASRPKSSSNQSDTALDAEETLSIDRARWSGFRDGVGERENGVDEQGSSIELLRLRKEFNPFALALTDRILRLIDFDRPGASRALRVDQDENSPRLVLVSERAPGFRLSELLERGAERGVIPDLGAALYLMRRLLATAAGIQQTTGIVQLAIAPDRILITPRGAVIIVEAAMAGAFQALGDRMPAQLRKAIRLHRADDRSEAAHVDIARITIAGMAMIVGRPIDAWEDIDPLSPVVQEVVEVAAVRAGDPFAAALTPWLDRAISVDPVLGFGAFADALADLEEIVPPPEARCPISRAPLRKLLADLAIDGSQLESEQDRLREIRARQVRRAAAPAQREAVSAPPSDAVADPAAAIMEMPVAVEDLSTEIFKQPVLIDDRPSAMSEVIKQAGSDIDDGSAASDPVGLAGEASDGVNATFETAFETDDEPTGGAEELFTESLVETTADLTTNVTGFEDEASADPHEDDGLLATESEGFRAADPSLEDLVDEILRRGVEPDLPELSGEGDTLEDLVAVPDYTGSVEYGAFGVAEVLPEPVDELAMEQPPVDEPVTEEPPIDEPATEEPPAEEPPPHEPPVQDPPPDEPPAEEPPPIWLRAAIEQVARARQDRPAPQAPRRPESRGPVFELPDEPERELVPETTTLSDIAKELGLTVPVTLIKPPTRSVIGSDVEPEVEPDLPAPADEPVENETAWDTHIRRTLFPSEPEPAPRPEPATLAPPPVFAPAPPPSVEPAHVFTPLPPVTLEPPTVPPPVAAAPIPLDAPPAPAPMPRRSIAERTADLRESGSRFGKLAATLVLVVGGIAAAAYGGWRYYSGVSTPGTLVVESTPPGAQVEIDGIQRGTTPVTLELPPGSHRVAMTRRGITRQFTVAVRSGEQSSQALDWSKVRETGSLAVATEPAGAKVSVDGKSYGVTPLTIPDLPAGRRRVVLEGQGGTVRREVTIGVDQTATLSEAIFSGFLAVFAPVELQIYEGNRLLGTTENSRIMIPAGRHELTLVNRELGSRLTRAVEVEPGQVAAINITEVPATVQPAAVPPAAPPN